MTIKQTDIITNKISKIGETFTVNMYDNGYMIELSGRNHSDDYSTVKVLVSTVEELTEIIAFVATMTRES